MKDQARGFAIATIVLAIALPILYVGTEGVWYLVTGKSHFPPDSAYRTLYAPLDWAGYRCSKLGEGRQALANGWMRLSGDPPRRVWIDALPPPSSMNDDVQYYPPPADFLARPVRAIARYQREDSSPSTSVEPDSDSSCSLEANYAESDRAETEP